MIVHWRSQTIISIIQLIDSQNTPVNFKGLETYAQVSRLRYKVDMRALYMRDAHPAQI
jgi:hypothetical protein